MKTKILSQVVCCAALAGVIAAPSALAKKASSLASFKGNYSGVVTLVTPSETASGTVTVLIVAPKKGKTATISYSAVINFSGGASTLPTEITLSGNKTVLVSDLGVGIAGTNNAHPGNGTFSLRRRTLSFSATNGDITLTGSAVVKDVKKKRKLSLVLVSSDASGTLTFTNTLFAKRPRSAK